MLLCCCSDVWKMYLSKGQFDLAKKYCKVGVYLCCCGYCDNVTCYQGNAAHLDEVLTKQAEYEFQQGK